jgi:DNA primase catalytic subunit
VYYTCGKWLNPTQIGPDPNGRYGRKKFIEKRWCTKNDTITLKRYHNTLLKKDLYFDVDYDNKDYNEGIKMVQRTIDLLMSMEQMGRYTLPKLTEDDIDIVFSGGKGFHVIVNGYYDMVKVGDQLFTEYVNQPNKNEMVQEFYQEIVNEMRVLDPGLLLDFMVTYDNRRIIRLPGTVHQKTLRVCRLLAGTTDERIIKDYDGKMVGYYADPPI